MFSTHCPHCRSVDFRGVGVRNVVEQAIHWILWPYRCTLCGHHFFLLRWLAPIGGTASASASRHTQPCCRAGLSSDLDFDITPKQKKKPHQTLNRETGQLALLECGDLW